MDMMQLEALFSLRDSLVEVSQETKRSEILCEKVAFAPFYTRESALAKEIKNLSPLDLYICHSLLVIGEEAIFDFLFKENQIFEHLREVERFFFPCGGIIGYYCMTLELIEQKKEKAPKVHLHQPQGYDLRKKKERFLAVERGISSLDQLAFLAPVGGAGDRFGLVDPKTKEPMPLAGLEFMGKSLLQRLIEDVIALEELYFEKEKRRIEIPIGLMSSDEKNNDAHVRAILRDAHYFGRSRTSFFIFKQPLVPVFDRSGKWVYGKKSLHFKPGGHGMLWRSAKLNGFFSYLKERKKDYLLVRQINNPIAGVDDGLLAFFGTGTSQNKHFGFASCPRRVGAKEGMNVVKEEAFRYTLTNIEYTDFARHGLEDQSDKEGSTFSVFPSNTNILFAKCTALEKAEERLPFPGPVLNFKTGKSARVELMMQNIADVMGEVFPHSIPQNELQRLMTFLTYNERLKTISVTKEQWSVERGTIDDTPVGALFDWLINMEELLEKCDFTYPKLDRESFVSEGAPFLFDYHPALGPNFSEIEKKLKKGSLSHGSALILDLSKAHIEGLHLEGGCRIHGADLSASCTLKNVSIRNDGGPSKDLIQAARFREIGGLEVFIESGGSFIAKNITIEGSKRIRVPAGESLNLKG